MVQPEPLDGTPAEVGTRDRLSTAAFVVGLVAALTGVVYFVAIPAGLVGLVLGVLAIRRPQGVRRIAFGGIMLSLIGLVVGMGVVAFLVLDDDAQTTTINGIKSETGDDEHPPQLDLQPDLRCDTQEHELAASGSVRNNSDRTSSYMLIAAWEQDGHQIAQRETKIEALAPAATAPWQVTVALETSPEDGAVNCRIIRIDRDAD
jgi:hypothetical protein